MCFEAACKDHDGCYGTAYVDKLSCDLDFFFELNRLCQTSGLAVDEFVVCTGRAAMYATFTLLAGSEAYGKAQVAACRCGDGEEGGRL